MFTLQHWLLYCTHHILFKWRTWGGSVMWFGCDSQIPLRQFQRGHLHTYMSNWAHSHNTDSSQLHGPPSSLQPLNTQTTSSLTPSSSPPPSYLSLRLLIYLPLSLCHSPAFPSSFSDLMASSAQAPLGSTVNCGVGSHSRWKKKRKRRHAHTVPHVQTRAHTIQTNTHKAAAQTAAPSPSCWGSTQTGYQEVASPKSHWATFPPLFLPCYQFLSDFLYTCLVTRPEAARSTFNRRPLLLFIFPPP